MKRCTAKRCCAVVNFSFLSSRFEPTFTPGGGVLPYMGYIGMCRCEGYGGFMIKQFTLG